MEPESPSVEEGGNRPMQVKKDSYKKKFLKKPSDKRDFILSLNAGYTTWQTLRRDEVMNTVRKGQLY